MSTRVVHVIDGLGSGGAERLLAIYATRLHRIGCDVHVVVLSERDGNPQQRAIDQAGVPTSLAPVDRLRSVRQIAHLWSTLRSLKPDVVHAHLEFSCILTSLFCWVHRIPCLATIHTLEAPKYSDRAGLHIWVMYKILERFCDRVICLSDAAASFGKKHGLGRARIEVLPNGIDLAEFPPQTETERRATREAWDIPEASLLILTVAVLRPPKGIDRLIRAMPGILAATPEAHLLVVGDGPEMSRLVDLAAELNVSENVTFAGQRTDVPDQMAAADVFVLPTLDDAQPTVIMEAMAARLPVIASRVGGVPDMISDRADGILVPPDDVALLETAISGLLADAAQRETLAKAGRATVEERFSLEGQVTRLNALYETLITEKAQRG